jgi:hypothetical protein
MKELKSKTPTMKKILRFLALKATGRTIVKKHSDVFQNEYAWLNPAYEINNYEYWNEPVSRFDTEKLFSKLTQDNIFHYLK